MQTEKKIMLVYCNRYILVKKRPVLEIQIVNLKILTVISHFLELLQDRKYVIGWLYDTFNVFFSEYATFFLNFLTVIYVITKINLLTEFQVGSN